MPAQPARGKPPASLLNVVESAPAPIGGLNARDPINAMPPTDAYNLINWIPQQYGVRVRKGYTDWATGMDGPVTTVMSYFPHYATIPSNLSLATLPETLPGQVFGVTDTNIFDITTRGAVGTPVRHMSGIQNAASITWHMFTNAAGSFLMCCSETDGYFFYDGTAWQYPTEGTGTGQIISGSPEYTCDPHNFCYVLPWNHRLYFIEKNTSHIWYLATDAIYGTATVFDVGPLLKHGGSLAWLYNWTIDAGGVINNYLVICGEMGDILIYGGQDPANPAGFPPFQIMGEWYVGPVPKGRDGFEQIGGDLVILSTMGIYPLSQVTRGGAQVLQATGKEYTTKIQNMLNHDVQSTFNMYGWHLHLIPQENILLVTVPNVTGIFDNQYALQLVVNEWTILQGIEMQAIDNIAGYTFVGASDGEVQVAFFGNQDDVQIGQTLGNPIYGLIQPAFSYFDRKEPDLRGRFKHFLLVRPTFLSTQMPSVETFMNVDFQKTVPAVSPAASTQQGSLFDSALWDRGVWGGDYNTYQDWLDAEGIGFAGSLSMATYTSADTVLTSIDYMFEAGGSL